MKYIFTLRPNVVDYLKQVSYSWIETHLGTRLFIHGHKHTHTNGSQNVHQSDFDFSLTEMKPFKSSNTGIILILILSGFHLFISWGLNTNDKPN